MKPFDIEQAKAGKPVTTNVGEDLTYLYSVRGETHVFIGSSGDYNEYMCTVRDSGRVLCGFVPLRDIGEELTRSCVLVTAGMKTEKKTVWVRIYKDDTSSTGFDTGLEVYNTSEEAGKDIVHPGFLGVFPIEIEY